MRLDGTSPAAFERSYAAMRDSLAKPDQVRLVLAMERIATIEANGKIERMPVEALRFLLKDKSYADLLRLADEPRRKFKVGFVTEPTSNKQ